MIFFHLFHHTGILLDALLSALALLIGSAMASENSWVRGGTRTLSVISAAAAATVIGIYWKVRHMPAPGDVV